MLKFERQQVPLEKLSDIVKAKWSEAVLLEGYTPFPKRFLRTLVRLLGESGEIGQLAAILAVVDYKRPRVSRPPSVDYLAFTAGVPVEVFKQFLGRLVERGWAEVKLEPPGDRIEVNIQGLQEAILKAIDQEESETWVNLD